MKATSSQTPSEHDFELLSAYLDDELLDSEREALEKRLSDDIQLRAALSSLRYTVRLIHDLPHLKAPRDFTLNPAIYSHKPSWWHLFIPGTFLQTSGALGAAASVMLIILALLYGKSEQIQVKESRQAAGVSITEQSQQPVALVPSPTTTLFATATLPIMTAAAVEEYAADDTASSEGAFPSVDAALPGEQGYYAPTQQIGIVQAAPSNQFSTNGDDDETGPSAAVGAAAPPAPTATMKMRFTASPSNMPPNQPDVDQSQNEPEMPPAAEAQDADALKDAETVTAIQVAQENALRYGSTAESDEQEQTQAETRIEGKDYRWLAGVGVAVLIGSLSLMLVGRRRSHQ